MIGLRRSSALLLIGAAAAAGDREALLEGVTAIGVPGVPGAVVAVGEAAVPVIAGRVAGRPGAVAAAARFGAGRVVVFGHDGYLTGDGAGAAHDTPRLVLNAIRWAAGGMPSPRVGALASESFVRMLVGRGLSVTRLADAVTDAGIAGVDVVCLDPARLSPGGERAVAAFTRSGGGLVAANTGWGWRQLHPGGSMTTDHPGNRMLAGCGLAWTELGLDGAADGRFHARTPLPASGPAAFAAVERGGPAGADAASLLLAAARCAAVPGSPFAARLAQWKAGHPAPPAPTPAAPLTPAGDPGAWLAFALAVDDALVAGPEALMPVPGSEIFPGAVPASARRVRRTVVVDMSRPGWLGTGLYAAPGARLTITLPPGAQAARLGLRIGAHTDELWALDDWKRAPAIARGWPLDTPRRRVGNGWGGPVYVAVPEGFARGRVPVTIDGAVELPRYVKGVTPAAEWNSRLRTLPAPWAELEGDRVVLTVPAEVARGVRDPGRVLAFWDRVLAAQADLAGERPHPRRKERIVADVQISAGYMHSGYPIMTQLDAAEVMVDPHRLMTDRRGGPGWGLFHELGHNLQRDDWTFDGTREVTCNLFTLYVLDRICGIPPRESRGELRPERRLAGATWERWTADPFIGLQPYVILQEEFGWEFYRKIFTRYRNIEEADRPVTDVDRMERWVKETSAVAGRDLGEFWKGWGLPVSAAPAAATPAH